MKTKKHGLKDGVYLLDVKLLFVPGNYGSSYC